MVISGRSKMSCLLLNISNYYYTKLLTSSLRPGETDLATWLCPEPTCSIDSGYVSSWSKPLCRSSGEIGQYQPFLYNPPNISTTSDRPDLVLVSDTEISILELTICHNSTTGFSKVQGRKEAKYAPRILDLEERGIMVFFVTLEVGT